MFRKVPGFLLSLFLCFCLIIPVSAHSEFIIDEANLLAPEETARLEEKSSELNACYDIHPVVLTVDSLNGSRAQDFADDYYDHACFGDNGVLFLLAMAEREWYISTSGCASFIFSTPSGAAKIHIK